MNRLLGRSSIRFKLAAFVAVIVAAMTALTFWLSYRHVSASLESEIERRMSIAMQDRNQLARSQLQTASTNLVLVSNRAELTGMLSNLISGRMRDLDFRRDVYRQLVSARADQPGVIEIFVLDCDRRVRGSTAPEWLERKPEEFLDAPVPTSDAMIGRPWRWKNHPRVALVSAPVFAADGPRVGSLVALYDLDPLLTLIEAPKSLGRTASIAIGAPAGSGVFFFTRDGQSTPVPDEVLARATRNESGLVHTKDRFGSDVLAAYSPVGYEDWGMTMSIDEAEAYAALGELRERLLIACVGVLLAGWIAAVLLSRHFARPILELAAAAEVVASGRFTVRVPIGRSDEIGHLAQDFNRMTGELERSYQTLEQRVRERTAELEAVNAEMSSFSHSVAHDLRAPLRAIAGYADILTEEKAQDLDQEGREMLERVQHNAHRLGQLIDDLMAFSGIGRREMRVEEIDPHDLVRDTLDDLQPETRGRRIDIEVRTLPRCRADASLLSLVFSNLLSNAIKYSARREHAHVVVGSEEQDGEVVYFVRDDGVGFDMRYAGQLFGVFQRLHPSSEFQGTGVGLAISRRIVERHGGRIWGHSEPGCGATFSFTLGASNTVLPAAGARAVSSTTPRQESGDEAARRAETPTADVS